LGTCFNRAAIPHEHRLDYQAAELSYEGEAPPQVVGVDDWAWKRGQRYGTILCDLVRRRPLDLLPDRETASTAAWLAQRPGITVVSRDRGGTYADAARQGAPEAVQVADRWQLLKNLGDALEEFLRRECIQLPLADQPTAARAEGVSTDGPGSVGTQATSDPTTAAVPTGRRQEAFTQVHARHQAGASIHAMAQELPLARNTVRRYLRSPSCPAWQRGRRRTRLDPYRDYLLQRWTAGCHNGRQLFRELQARGYRGGRSQVSVFVARLREGLPLAPAAPPTPRQPSPRELRWLLARRPDELDLEARRQVRALLATSPAVATAYALVQRFGRMVRDRQGAELETWLTDARSSGIAALGSFVQGIQRDRAAVEAGLTLEWSQGQTEGHITRLKLLKRQMYGRAKFDLLRQRMHYRLPVA
jgi:transposase